MNNIETQKAIDVMQASVAGKHIEYRSKGEPKWRVGALGGNWGWDWSVYEYRVRVEPRVRYFVESAQGTTKSNFESEQEALEWLGRVAWRTPGRVVKFVEVIDE